MKDEEEKPDIRGFLLYMILNFLIILTTITVSSWILFLLLNSHFGVSILLIIGIIFLYILTIERESSGWTNKYWKRIQEAFEAFNPFVKYK